MINKTQMLLLPILLAGLFNGISLGMEIVSTNQENPFSVSLFIRDNNDQRCFLQEDGKISEKPGLWINKNKFKMQTGEFVHKPRPLNEIWIGAIVKYNSDHTDIHVTDKYSLDKDKGFKFIALDEKDQLALPITINSRQQEKLRQMQLDLQGKATAVVNDQLVFIYDCCYTTDDTKLIPDKVTYSEIWDNFDDSFSEEAEEVISSPSTTIDIPQSQGNYNENKPLIVKGLYQYSPISEQYQLVNEKGFSTDNMQSLEAKFRGIIIKNENNTFCFQVTAEQINKLWQSTSKNLISIQLTSEQFKLLEQNQQINNPDKKTFVIVNAAQQVFIVEKVIKKSYFTARNIAVGLGFSFIGVMIYYCIKYNVSFSDLKISELFHKLSFSRTA